jgi:hypothetical protein
MFNLKKKAQIKPTEKMLDDSDKKFDIASPENPATITTKLLEEGRKHPDGDKIGEKQLKEVRVEAEGVITEKQLNSATGGINQKRRDDGVAPIYVATEYQKDEKKAITKDFRKQNKPDEDTAFWDYYLDIGKPKIVGNVQKSQLLSNYADREEMLKKNPSIKKKAAVESLMDADAMLYHTYRKAIVETRDLSEEEIQIVADINSAKIRILSSDDKRDKKIDNQVENDWKQDEMEGRADEEIQRKEEEKEAMESRDKDEAYWKLTEKKD